MGELGGMHIDTVNILQHNVDSVNICGMIFLMSAKTYHHGNLKEALIAAGLEILSEKGMDGLSLRNVAKRVGVSRAAPYNHFPNKQAMLAAISTAGHKLLYQTLLQAFERSKRSSTDIIIEIAWSYLQFALDDPGRFKLMFSGALEEERDHPDYVEISRKNISLFEEIIVYCQRKGQIADGRVENIAIKFWSMAHGFAYLVLEDQFPREFIEAQNLKEILRAALSS